MYTEVTNDSYSRGSSTSVCLTRFSYETECCNMASWSATIFTLLLLFESASLRLDVREHYVERETSDLVPSKPLERSLFWALVLPWKVSWWHWVNCSEDDQLVSNHSPVSRTHDFSACVCKRLLGLHELFFPFYLEFWLCISCNQWF